MRVPSARTCVVQGATNLTEISTDALRRDVALLNTAMIKGVAPLLVGWLTPPGARPCIHKPPLPSLGAIEPP